ncbi:EAL domain-containing protein [Aeromonas hydrophila]|uniref:EAL domain-containing protein n=1 Tax=Aeromonas hydrophila TaxID=644 RepID=UPI001CDCF6C2|nr:EAL domain-containing protein [Aeromonas hydrophila]MCA4698419.1 EAL domain-containing protein [Aeromonas hydrophila]
MMIRQHSFFAYKLYYQPIVDISHRRLIGVEALLRVKDLDGEFISPFSVDCGRRFISRIENDDVFFAEFLCHFENDIKLAQDTLACVFLNVSIGNIFDGTFLKWLKNSKLKPEKLCIELVERRHIEWNNENVFHKFRRGLIEIKGMGCKLALDDFDPARDAELLDFLQHDEFIDYIKIEYDCYMKYKSSDLYYWTHTLGLDCEKIIIEKIECEMFIKALQDTECSKNNSKFQGFFFTEALEYNKCIAWISNYKSLKF